MDTNELIARLAKENAELKDEVAELREKVNQIPKMLYSIGGPLNDNIFKYSEKQLRIFFDIIKVLEA